MNALNGGPIEPARQQGIFSPEEWRGRCLNIFARNELAVAKTIEAARDAGLVNKIAHLAGQRLAALEGIVRDNTLPARLRMRLDHAIADWKVLEQRRVFLAHAVTRTALERSGDWVLLMDVTIYRANIGTQNRWALLQQDAESFFTKLERATNEMTQLLGNLRTQFSKGTSDPVKPAEPGPTDQ